MDDAAPSVDQAQVPNDATPQHLPGKVMESNIRPFVRYTRAELLRLSKSPLVKIPDGMPPFKEWFGEWTESGAAARKEPPSEPLGQIARDRRFRRDTEDGDTARDLLSSGRPAFKNPLSFSQASGSAMGSMGSFRHPSSRLDADARREERDREREREGRRDTENLRNLSVQFDRERRDREAAPHLPRVMSSASGANGRDPKARDLGRDSREGAKESSREPRRGRGDDNSDWRRAREDDGRPRSRSRARERPGRGDREPANGQKRERDNWVVAEDRRGTGGGRRRGAEDGKPKDDRATAKSEREKSAKDEQEPAWMGDYVPETGAKGILGAGGLEDGIQAWKRELKEKERGAQSADITALDDQGLGQLEDDISRLNVAEDRTKQEKPNFSAEDDGLDEIQKFKKMMQESDRKRREEAERNARELAGKTGSPTGEEQATDIPAATLAVPPGLIKPSDEPSLIPPPTSEPPVSINNRVGGVSLVSPSWPISPTTVASTIATAQPSPGWAQPNGGFTDTSSANPRLSPIQARRFTQDGGIPSAGGQDVSQVGTRSTSRFANFFGDKQRDPAGPAPRFNDNPTSSPPQSFLQGPNEPQLLDTLLARLAESQSHPQTQLAPQGQDRAFGLRTQGGNVQHNQYGNVASQNPVNLHSAPPLIQHQRQQLSLHQQQQQLLSSLNADSMLVNNLGNPQGMNPGSLAAQLSGANSGLMNPSLNLDIDGRFVSDNLVPGLRPRNGSIGFDEDFQVNAGGAGRMQHRAQPSFDALHGRSQQQQSMYGVNSRAPSGGYRNGPSPIGGHNPNPMQRAPELPQYLGGMSGPPGGIGAGGANGPQQQYSNRLGGGNLGGMLGAVNQPRFDERQRMQQAQNASMHHQSGQSLSGMGGLPLDFNLAQQQQASQRQTHRGYGIQNQASMGPRGASGIHGLGAQQYAGHMHDFIVQPNQNANANDIMAMFLANQGSHMGA